MKAYLSKVGINNNEVKLNDDWVELADGYQYQKNENIDSYFVKDSKKGVLKSKRGFGKMRRR